MFFNKLARAEKFRQLVDKDYNPMNSVPIYGSPGVRSANAAEYTAYQIGQMNRKLDRLIAAVERIAAK